MGTACHSVSGNPAIVLSPAVAPVESLKFHFLPSQEGSGDPSTSNVRNVTGRTNIVAYKSGRNVLPFESVLTEGYTNTVDGVTATYSKGVVTMTGTHSVSGWSTLLAFNTVWASNPIVLPAGTYNFSNGSNNGQYSTFCVCCRIDGGSLENKSAAITATQSVTVLGFYVAVYGEGTVDSTTPLVMAPGEDRPTKYEPYVQIETINADWTSAGKNLLNPVTENILFKNNHVTATPGASGEVTVYFPGGAANCMFRIATVSKAMVGKTYCYSGTNTEAERDVFVVSDADGSNRNVKWTTVYTVQEADVGKELCVRVWRNTQTTITFSNLQVEEGSTPTTFEPYTNVCYGGWADPAKGELTVEYIKLSVAKEQFTQAYISGAGYRQTTQVYPPAASGVNWNMARQQQMCNKARIANPYSESPTTYTDYMGVVFTMESNTSVACARISEALYQALEAEETVEFTYKLMNPYTVPLTPQLISTLRGTTTFWSEANDAVEVEYEVIDSSEMVKAKKRVVANSPHLVYDASATAVKRFSTDMKSPLKNCAIAVGPTQEGSGDPALDNRRNIVGYNKFGLRHTGKNLAYVVGYSAQAITSASYNDMRTANGYGTTLSTLYGTAPSVVITQAETNNASVPSDYRNGYFEVLLDGIEFGKTYKFSFEVENIVSNPLGVQLTNMLLYSPAGYSNGNVDVEGNRVVWKYTHLKNPNSARKGIEVRNCGMSFTIKNVMLTELEESDQSYEPFVHVLGKNIARIKGFSATTGSYNATNSYGTSLNTTSPNTGSVVITQTNASQSPKHSYRNGYFCVDVHGLEWNKSYDISFRISNIVNNPLDAALNELKLVSPYGNAYSVSSVNDDRVVFANFKYTQNTNSPYITAIDIRNCGMSFTMSEFMVTEVGEDQTYVPCIDNEYLMEFPETLYAGGCDPTMGTLALFYAGKTDVLSNYDEKIVYDNGYTRYRFDFVPYAVNTNANQKCDILPYSWQAQTGGAHFYAYTVSETSTSRILLYVPTGTDESTQWTAIAELTYPAFYQLDSQQIKTMRGNNVLSIEGNSAMAIRYWTH